MGSISDHMFHQWTHQWLHSLFRMLRKSEISVGFLFSQNFAYMEFRKNNPLVKWRFFPFPVVGKPCQSRNFLTWQICLLTLYRRVVEIQTFEKTYIIVIKDETGLKFKINYST